MNKWKGSWVAKLCAWVGITVSGSLFLASVVGAFAIWDAGIYDTDREQYKKNLFHSAANQYAVQALSELENTEKDKWNDTYFRYGIIKAENIDRMNFNDESIYVERNFTKRVTADDLYMVSHELGDDTAYEYSGTLFGGYAVSSDNDGSLTDISITDVIYNEDMGVFYYATDGDYFPVKEVKLGYTTNEGRVVYQLSYDFEEDMYRTQEARLVGMSGVQTQQSEETQTDNVADGQESEAGTETDKQESEAGTESDEQESDAETESGGEAGEAGTETDGQDSEAKLEKQQTLYYADADEILKRDYITLDMLGSTGWNYTKWEYLIIDGKQYINDGFNVMWVGNDHMANADITDETDYELTANNRIRLASAEVVDETDTYWVVVLLPESVGMGWNEDLFVQANAITEVGYALRYSIYLIGAVAFAVTIALLVFLLNAAGHRCGSEEIVTTWIDRMPFDVYLGLAMVAEGTLLVMVRIMAYYIHEMPGLVGFVTFLICMCLVALFSLLTFAVRVKIGKWWRNTVIYMLFHSLYKGIQLAAQHMSLFWKMILLVAGIKFAELFLAVMLLNYGSVMALLLGALFEGLQFFAIFWGAVQMQQLKKGGAELAAGNFEHSIDTEKMYWEFRQHGENLNCISEGMSRAVNERMKSERFKTELITNVSHDIKTPLTSIINYVDLLEKEELENEAAQEYIEVLERQSGRLKKLIQDLIEASKASTGNLAVHLECLDAGVFLVQTVGEFEEKTLGAKLELVIAKPGEAIYIMADSRHFWRVIDNLMNNICKYAQQNTRVYINLEEADGKAVMTFRNTSKYPLNISSEELMERFVRGDSSRNTEGSGLGLSIARSLMELMGGTFELFVDGDLFKVVLKFAVASKDAVMDTKK